MFIRASTAAAFAVEAVVGERVEVWADIYRDGHDVVAHWLTSDSSSPNEKGDPRNYRRMPSASSESKAWSRMQLTKEPPVTTISRRLFLQAVAATASTPAFAQEPAARGNQAPRDTTPLVPPFESTGWKTVWLDHLNYQCVDYKKGRRVLRDADGMEGAQRRRQAGVARHRRELGRHHHSRRTDRAAAGGDHRCGPRRQSSAGAGRVRRLRVGHRAVGHRHR